MTKSRMRPEARPLRLDVLDYYQKEAIEKVSAVLLEALGHVKGAAQKGASRGDLDIDRASRLFFISGEAGGGKTTVYLSLRKALEEGVEAPPAGFPRLTDLLPDRKKLIWLDPLDLESTPEAHNYLAATLERIDRALSGKVANARGKERRRGVLEDSSDEARQAFENLCQDVVLAWEGNLRERAEHIDPDTYSMEVIRSAKASLRINARFLEAVEGLMKEDDWCRESLLILPVDDLYLNPSSSLDLLRFLRMISIPRLFVLVLGNFFVIEELFYQNMLGKLVRQAGEHAFLHIERQTQTLTSTATELTAHSLRKLIPPAQRYWLEVMHQLGALEFHPSRLDPAFSEEQGKPELETLECLLAKLPVNLERAGKDHGTLFGFICLRDSAKERKDDEYYTYSGLAILDLPPREVVDLWYSIKNALPKDHWESDKKGWEATLVIVADAAVAAISGQNYISKQAQDLCSYAIKGHRGYEKLFDTSYLSVSPDLAPWLRVPLKDGVVLEAATHKGWLFYPRREVDSSASMAPRPTAWLTVLHDLMALSGEDRLIGEPLTPGPFDFGLVCVKQGDRQLIWPTPRWISFWHFDRLSFVWRKVVQKAKNKKKSLDFSEWLAFHWIRSVVDILLDQQKLDAQPDANPADKLGWAKLVKDVKALKLKAEAEEPEARTMIEEWLMYLFVLSPQYAVPETVSKRLSPALSDFWKKKEKDIQRVIEDLEARHTKKPAEKPAS